VSEGSDEKITKILVMAKDAGMNTVGYGAEVSLKKIA